MAWRRRFRSSTDEQALHGHALSHRMLRIFEAARAESGEDVVDRLYAEWGARYIAPQRPDTSTLLADCVAAAGLDDRLHRSCR